MSVEQRLAESTSFVEPLKPSNTFALMLDVDYSIFDNKSDLLSPAKILQKVVTFNEFLATLQEKTGFNLIPVISTQRPWTKFLGNIASPRYTPLLRINQKRFDETHQPISIPSTIAICELGGVALMRTPAGEWKMQENPNLTQGLGLKQQAINLTNWLIKMGFAPEPNRTYPGKNIGDQYIGDTVLEPGNEFYVALQERSEKPMTKQKKRELKKLILDTLYENDEKKLLDAFTISTDGHDLDFLPRIYQNKGKIIATDWLIKMMRHDYPWFSLKNILVVDDQNNVAAKLFEKVISAGGYTVTPANADTGLKNISLGNPHAIVSKYPYFLGVIDGIHRALTGKPYPH